MEAAKTALAAALFFGLILLVEWLSRSPEEVVVIGPSCVEAMDRVFQKTRQRLRPTDEEMDRAASCMRAMKEEF